MSVVSCWAYWQASPLGLVVRLCVRHAYMFSPPVTIHLRTCNRDTYTTVHHNNTLHSQVHAIPLPSSPLPLRLPPSHAKPAPPAPTRLGRRKTAKCFKTSLSLSLSGWRKSMWAPAVEISLRPRLLLSCQPSRPGGDSCPVPERPREREIPHLETASNTILYCTVRYLSAYHLILSSTTKVKSNPVLLCVRPPRLMSRAGAIRYLHAAQDCAVLYCTVLYIPQ